MSPWLQGKLWIVPPPLAISFTAFAAASASGNPVIRPLHEGVQRVGSDFASDVQRILLPRTLDQAQACDDVIVVRYRLDRTTPRRLQFFQKPARQRVGADERRVHVDHDEGAVDVNTIAAQIYSEQLDALRLEHLFQLPRPLFVDPDRAPDHRRPGIYSGKTATFHQAAAANRSKDGHTKVSKRSSHGQFFTAADLRSQPADGGAAIDGYGRVPHSCAHAQRLYQRIMLHLHLGKRRHRVALPVPAMLRVAE